MAHTQHSGSPHNVDAMLALGGQHWVEDTGNRSNNYVLRCTAEGKARYQNHKGGQAHGAMRGGGSRSSNGSVSYDNHKTGDSKTDRRSWLNRQGRFRTRRGKKDRQALREALPRVYKQVMAQEVLLKATRINPQVHVHETLRPGGIHGLLGPIVWHGVLEIAEFFNRIN